MRSLSSLRKSCCNSSSFVLLCLLAVLVLEFACSGCRRQSIPEKPAADCLKSQGHTLEIPLKSGLNSFEILETQDTTYLICPNKALDSFAFFCQVGDTFRFLRLQTIPFKGNLLDYCPLTPDHFLLLDKMDNVMYSYTFSSRVFTEYDFPDQTAQYEKYRLYSQKVFYKMMAGPDGSIYIYHFPTDKTETGGNANPRYYKNFDLKVALNDSTVHIAGYYGQYPEKLRENSYKSTAPFRALGHDHTLVYSFQAIDSVYALEHDRYVPHYFGSNYYIAPRRFDDNSTNYFYKKQYEVENSRFLSIAYNPYRHAYYRVLSHKINFINPDNTVNNFLNKPWSVVIADDGFHLKNEIVFPPDTYYPYLFITSGGIIVFHPKVQNEKIYHYDIFDF